MTTQDDAKELLIQEIVKNTNIPDGSPSTGYLEEALIFLEQRGLLHQPAQVDFESWRYYKGWNDCIDELSKRGLLKAGG